MLKFIRRYQTWILAIGGTLLMVVFLLPQAAQQLGGDPRKRTYATLEGGKITIGERSIASRQVDALQSFVPILLPQLGIDPDNDIDHYMLLTAEARRHGLVGGPADGEAWVPQLATELVNAMFFQQFGSVDNFINSPAYTAEVERAQNELINRVPFAAGRSQLMLDEFYQAMANLRGIQRLIRQTNSAARVANYQVVNAAKDRLNAAYVTAVPVLAGVIDDDFQPTDEQLQATFEQYKDIAPSGGEFAVGYTLPRRIKFQWLTLDRTRLANAVTVDPVELRKAWQRDRETYPGEFTEERDTVRTALTDAAVARAMNVADRVIRSEVLTSTRRLEKTGNYYDLPRDWTPIDLEAVSVAVAEALESEMGIATRRPSITYRDIDWTELGDIAQIPGLGQAAFRTGSQSTPLSVALDRLNAFDPDASLLPLQVGVPVVDPVLSDTLGNQYYVLVTEAREVSPPDSYEEVRRQLTFDTRDLRRYEMLLADQDNLLDIAKREGLAPIQERYSNSTTLEQADGRPRPRIQIDENIEVRPDSVLAISSSIFNRASFRDAVLEHARTIDPTLMGDAIPEDQRYFVVELPRIKAIAICQMELYVPISAERFRGIAPGLTLQTTRDQLVSVLGAGNVGPLAYDTLVERLQYDVRDRDPADDIDTNEDAESEEAGENSAPA